MAGGMSLYCCISVTWTWFVVMIVSLHIRMQYMNLWLKYRVENQKRWFFIGKSTSFVCGHCQFDNRRMKHWVEKQKRWFFIGNRTSFVWGHCEFYIRKSALRACAALRVVLVVGKVNGKPYLRTRSVISTSLFQQFCDVFLGKVQFMLERHFSPCWSV